MTVFIFKMEKDIINSGKGSVFFELRYNPTTHYPEYLARLMNEHPVAVEYKAKGYVGPVTETQYINNWEEELSKADDEITKREPNKRISCAVL